MKPIAVGFGLAFLSLIGYGASAADCDVLVVGGGAAGIAAALAVRRQCDVRSVPIAELRARLTASGAIVPAVAAERKGR